MTNEPGPGRSVREVQQALVAMLTDIYTRGEPEPGEALTADWSLPGDRPWTGGELALALSSAMCLFLSLAWDADRAHAAGEPPDIDNFLRRQGLLTALKAGEEPIPADGDLWFKGETE